MIITGIQMAVTMTTNNNNNNNNNEDDNDVCEDDSVAPAYTFLWVEGIRTFMRMR